MKRHGLVLLLSLLAVTQLAARCQTNEVELTILHTNDLHSHLKPSRVDPFGLGGFARLSTLIKERRKANATSLTIDAGDWSEGSWYHSLDVGANMLRLLDRMGVDAAALGNHDFLSGPDQLVRTLTEANASFPVLAANLNVSQYPDAARLKRLLPDTVIKTVKASDGSDIKVGIIGLTTFEMLYDSYFAPVKIVNPIEAATAAAKTLRPQVDVLLITSHNSFATNVEIAKAVPGVDAVISGHTHIKLTEAVLAKNAGRDVPVVECNEWGKFLGELKLSLDRGQKTVRFKSWKLHPVTDQTAEDPEVLAFIDEQDRALKNRFGVDVNRTVTQSPIELRKDSGEIALANLMVRAYRDAAPGSDMALDQSSFTSVAVPKGPVNALELHDVMPHILNASTGREWTIQLWNARGSDLLLVLQVFYTINSMSPFPTGAFPTIDNALVIWDPTARRKSKGTFPVRSVQIAGKALDPSARYRVATGQGFMDAIREANEKFHLGFDLSQVQDTGIEVWRAILAYGAKNPELPLEALRVGTRTLAQGADLATFYYSLDWDGRALEAKVENQGLKSSTSAKLTCFSGLANNVLFFETDRQSWKKIGETQIPALPPNGTAGNDVTVRIPWSSVGLEKGRWPVRCLIEGGGDTYAGNNQADTVFVVEGVPSRAEAPLAASSH